MSCGCSLSSYWNFRMRGAQPTWYSCAATLLLSECRSRQLSCCLGASSIFLSCYWFYFCHICQWPSMLAILPTRALVLLGVLSCGSVCSVISVSVVLLFDCGLDVFLQPGWRHDRLQEQGLKLVPCLNLSYGRGSQGAGLSCLLSVGTRMHGGDEYIPIKPSRGTNLNENSIYTCRYTPPSCGTRPEMSTAEILLLEESPMERGIKYQIKCQ